MSLDQTTLYSGKTLFQKAIRLITVIQNLSIARTHEEIRDIVKHAARELVGSDGATFVLRDKDQCYYVDEYAIAPLWKGKRFPMSACISGWVMENKRSTAIPDIYSDPRIPSEAYRPTFVKSLIMVPIRKIDPIGAIGNYWRDIHQSTHEEILLLEALADSTAIAIENVNLYAQLEDKVLERTHELALANKELEAFSYSVSHDLRAPLRAIDGFSHLLLKKKTLCNNEEAHILITKMTHNVQNMSELIDGLLMLSKITKTDIDQDKVNLSKLCKEILQEYSENHPECKIKWSVDESMEVYGDRKLLRILVENILTNACKFSSKVAAPEIKVQKKIQEKQIIVSFTDNGVGFSMEEAELIFEPFRRLHHEYEFEGTGIGLAIVSRIVARLHGSIWVESQPNQGTTFFIMFPIPQKEA